MTKEFSSSRLTSHVKRNGSKSAIISAMKPQIFPCTPPFVSEINKENKIGESHKSGMSISRSFVDESFCLPKVYQAHSQIVKPDEINASSFNRNKASALTPAGSINFMEGTSSFRFHHSSDGIGRVDSGGFSDRLTPASKATLSHFKRVILFYKPVSPLEFLWYFLLARHPHFSKAGGEAHGVKTEDPDLMSSHLDSQKVSFHLHSLNSFRNEINRQVSFSDDRLPHLSNEQRIHESDLELTESVSNSLTSLIVSNAHGASNENKVSFEQNEESLDSLPLELFSNSIKSTQSAYMHFPTLLELCHSNDLGLSPASRKLLRRLAETVLYLLPDRPEEFLLTQLVFCEDFTLAPKEHMGLGSKFGEVSYPFSRKYSRAPFGGDLAYSRSESQLTSRCIHFDKAVVESSFEGSLNRNSIENTETGNTVNLLSSSDGAVNAATANSYQYVTIENLLHTVRPLSNRFSVRALWGLIEVIIQNRPDDPKEYLWHYLLHKLPTDRMGGEFSSQPREPRSLSSYAPMLSCGGNLISAKKKISNLHSLSVSMTSCLLVSDQEESDVFQLTSIKLPSTSLFINKFMEPLEFDLNSYSKVCLTQLLVALLEEYPDDPGEFLFSRLISYPSKMEEETRKSEISESTPRLGRSVRFASSTSELSLNEKENESKSDNNHNSEEIWTTNIERKNSIKKTASEKMEYMGSDADIFSHESVKTLSRRSGSTISKGSSFSISRHRTNSKWSENGDQRDKRFFFSDIADPSELSNRSVQFSSFDTVYNLPISRMKNPSDKSEIRIEYEIDIPENDDGVNMENAVHNEQISYFLNEFLTSYDHLSDHPLRNNKANTVLYNLAQLVLKEKPVNVEDFLWMYLSYRHGNSYGNGGGEVVSTFLIPISDDTPCEPILRQLSFLKGTSYSERSVQFQDVFAADTKSFPIKNETDQHSLFPQDSFSLFPLKQSPVDSRSSHDKEGEMLSSETLHPKSYSSLKLMVHQLASYAYYRNMKHNSRNSHIFIVLKRLITNILETKPVNPELFLLDILSVRCHRNIPQHRVLDNEDFYGKAPWSHRRSLSVSRVSIGNCAVVSSESITDNPDVTSLSCGELVQKQLLVLLLQQKPLEPEEYLWAHLIAKHGTLGGGEVQWHHRIRNI